MNVALTYNPPYEGREGDTPETIVRLTAALRALGHDVRAVDVARPLDELVVALRGLAPELVFNLAEGERGRFREAFYPALYEHLGFLHTGSSASVLAVCLDKALAKRLVAAAGVRVPAGVVVVAGELPEVAFPAIVKPNFEGSSLGITERSVVTTRAALERVVAETLARYPAGVLVEDYITGYDIAVGWVEGVGMLAPVRYHHAGVVFDEAHKRAHLIEVVDGEAVRAAARRAFSVLGVTGYGRADFRVTPSGEVVFLEMNPLPSLAHERNELYAAGARLGKTPDELVAAIVAAATISM